MHVMRSFHGLLGSYVLISISFVMICFNQLCCCIQPKVVSDTDELELAKQLERLEEQNREVSGDEGSESENDEDEEGDEDGEKKDVEVRNANDDAEEDEDMFSAP